MTKPTYKAIQFFLSLLTLAVLFASLYFQYVAKMQPCPLCLMQRFCLFLLLGLMGLGLGSLKRAHWISFAQVLIASAGLYFTLRQLWLQSLSPSEAPTCLPGLDILIKYFPWQTVARSLFWGSGDCAEATQAIFGMSMPGWAAVYFFIMLITGLYLFIATRGHEA